ncbi:V-type H+-transporting ATPase subunit AC39 [Angomonas deanei]|uniref:V-type proton ATPase subunit n=1 Tax=Angomonas deanei TaxID=59799 RepID=A0A7G2CVH7_9TRYP|nr:V-type H+-transporting ATPase subunit AC39 [Angomonas deanei]CAD2222423.1 ATP synthase (C/AC39) subunit, putative [Angomonas deanei]|eukprot:EPY25304.1 V-type H+-transporting ATPase subunit AC39 [Angomonas deanei]
MSRDMLTYNVHEGNLEAMVHGYRDALLRVDEYNNLCQCDNLSDLKSQLQVTDYGNFLQQESALTTRIIVDKAQEVMVRQFREMRAWSEPPLCDFMDFISYEHMISNVLKLIIAKRSGRSNLELLTKCHPLGLFPELPTLLAATDVREMFEVVLVDSPVGRFFSADGFERDLDELSVEFIRGMLMKNYYQQFYDFCYELGGETREVMCPLLDAEADRLVLTFTLNTLGVREITPADRRRVFPNLGSLVDIHDDIAESENDEQLRDRLRRFPTYYDLLDDSRSIDTSNKKSIERRFVELSVVLYSDAMTRQFQYGIFYAYVKLKELEISNLQWISDCVVQQIRNRLHEYVNIVAQV